MKKILSTLLIFSSFISLHAQCSLDFGSTVGDFTFAYVSGTDIVNGSSTGGGANGTSSQSFDIWNEGAAPIDCSSEGGTSDITFDFEIVNAFDANTPGDGIIDAYAGTTHDITQSPSGLKGKSPLGNSGSNESSTGDVRGYKITVKFASHINVTADEITVNTTSVSSGGKAFESCAVIFLDETGTPYGTPTYEGYYGNGSAGASTDGTCSTPAPGIAWSTTGLGVYTMSSSGSVVLDAPTNPCTAISGTNGSDNNKDVAAVADASLMASDRVGGFTFIVYLEDIAPSNAPGANTLTSASISSTLNGFTISASLPVELTSFEADIYDESVVLNWNTASEMNNDYFEIEHSMDGIDFGKIGIEEGNGQSDISNDYRFIDAQPKSGINYYRLKQVDFDGKYEYSNIVFVDFKKEEKINIYPTLSTSEINVTLPGNGKEINYKILNLTGQILQEGSFENDSANTTTEKIDIHNVPNGNYFIQIGNKSFSETLRFIKM